MLIVRVELWPNGFAALRTPLGIAGIANISGTDVERADYVAALMDPLGHDLVVRRINRHERAAGFWPLVSSATRRPTSPAGLADADSAVADLIRQRVLLRRS